MSQSFYPVDPVECTPSTTGAWVDIDLDDYITGLGTDVTGVVLHVVNKSDSSYRDFSFRKNGSTDNIINDTRDNSHCWAMIGVDSNHIF